ncbi:MAG: nucleotidyltransferase family protein [Phycisphaerae bacterium]
MVVKIKTPKEKIKTSSRESVIQLLKKNRSRIKKFGVQRLGIFGSISRNEAGVRSDVDILVDFNETTYRKYIDLKSLLEKILGRRVDLLTPPALENRLKDNVLKDLIDVQVS